MKFIRIVCLVFVIFSGQAWAEPSFENAWVRLLPPSVKTTAAYMTINSPVDDVLLSASSPVAMMVELHLSSMTDGVMSMDHVERIDLRANQPVELIPGGYHLMLMGLKKALSEGDRFPLTLIFDKAGEIEIELPVKR